MINLWNDYSALKKDMTEKTSYLCSDNDAFTINTALQLGKPLLIEGPPGSGKTEVAKVLASLLGTELIRLQCYEGLDEGKALYEWNYQKQILDIQKRENTDIFGTEYLMPRPLLMALQAEQQPVLLIDEIDKVDPEFEAFLMEILSDFQVSIPEFGTVRAVRQPVVVVTSNAVRDLGDALRRRCVYLYLDYPSISREASIIMLKIKGIKPLTALKTGRIMFLLRNELQLIKPPSISETLDLAQAFVNLKITEPDYAVLNRLNPLFLKTREDQEQYEKKGGGKWICENL